MAERIFNFNPGPATLPLEVLKETSKAVLDFQNLGMSILEVSHRSKEYDAVHNETVELFKEIYGIPDGYKVLFLGGGASLQFAMVPLNCLGKDQSADYIKTGNWSKRAIQDASAVGKVNVIYSSEKTNYDRVPKPSELKFTPNAAYVHITSNNTIYGTQFSEFPDTGRIPIVSDMSSDFLSRRVDWNRFALIYAGAQKNVGPAGVTVVIVRDDFIERAPQTLPPILQYRMHAEKNSLFNTPPVFAIYVMHGVLRWIQKSGGLSKIEKVNREKAKLLYDAIDASEFYRGTAQPYCRSLMNVTFRLPNEELEKTFVAEAAEEKMGGLKGHRSVGGIRASLYNAFPIEGVKALVQFMKAFEKKIA